MQRLVLGFSSLVIGAIGSVIVLESENLIPALLAHAAFAVFFVRYAKKGQVLKEPKASFN